MLLALYQQRIYRLLARETKQVADRTIRLLPPTLSRTATDFLIAHRELYRLTPPIGSGTIKTARARPAATLLGYYREAQQRFGSRGMCLCPSTSSRRSSESCAARAPPAHKARCSSCLRRGGAMGWAATSTMRTMRSSGPPTTSTPPARRETYASRCITTTRRPHTSTRPSLRQAHRVRPDDLLRSLQLAGFRQDTERRSPRNRPGSRRLSSPYACGSRSGARRRARSRAVRTPVRPPGWGRARPADPCP